MNRRQFLHTGALATAGSALAGAEAAHITRGVVLYPFDLSLGNWPERCAKAGINTIGLHAARRLNVLVDFIGSDKGQEFLARCAKLGIAVEFEMHAMNELLSREFYYHEPGGEDPPQRTRSLDERRLPRPSRGEHESLWRGNHAGARVLAGCLDVQQVDAPGGEAPVARGHLPRGHRGVSPARSAAHHRLRNLH
jgi:hypothetical protein